MALVTRYATNTSSWATPIVATSTMTRGAVARRRITVSSTSTPMAAAAAIPAAHATGQGQGDVHGLLDEHDRRAVGVEPAHGVEQAFDHDGREAERELIDEQDPGAQHEGPSQGQHLLLPARERARGGGQAIAQLGEQV